MNPANLSLISVPLNSITGLDKTVAEMLESEGYETDTALDLDAWDKNCARWIYFASPMIVAARKDGYEVVGTGRAWRLAIDLFETDENVPVMLLPSARLRKADKLCIVAAELFGLAAAHRTRRHIPRRMMGLWEKLKAEGVDSILGEGRTAFSRGSGYSLKALPAETVSVAADKEEDPY